MLRAPARGGRVGGLGSAGYGDAVCRDGSQLATTEHPGASTHAGTWRGTAVHVPIHGTVRCGTGGCVSTMSVIAIMAIDPGRVTGVARGLFGPGTEAGMRDALASAVGLETWEVDGPAPVQAWELVAEFQEWMEGLVRGGTVGAGEVGESVWLCIEDFRLRTQNVDLDPVLVLGGVTTLLVPRVA